MTTVPCRLCGAGATFRLRAGDLNRGLTREAFDYYECQSCGTVFLPSVPADLGRYYPRDYYSLPASAEALKAGSAPEEYKVALVRRFVPGGRLLEIGPAVGGFALLAKEAGYQVHAIEMDPECCRFLEEAVGVRAVCSSDPASALAGMEEYDVIALWHVIEHVPDPVALLKAAASRVAPGGILLLAAPNPGALQFRLFGPSWVHLDAPRHLQLVPAGELERIGASLGLRPLLTTFTDSGSLGWNEYGWQYSLRNVLRPGSGGYRLRAAARAVTRALSGLERTGTRGSAYTLVLGRGAREVLDPSSYPKPPGVSAPGR